MRLFYFLCLILLFILTSCYEPSRNCNDYKTGVFYSEIEIGGELFKYEFKRSESLQIETYNRHIDSSSLRWINDCEVVIKTINPRNMTEKKDVHLKILTTTDSSYTFEYSYVGETKKQKGIAFKVK